MTQKNISYEGLQKDPDFISSAYHTLRALGENRRRKGRIISPWQKAIQRPILA